MSFTPILAFEVNSDIQADYSYGLIVVSVLISMTAAYTAFSLVDRMRSSATLSGRCTWLLYGAITMGLGIWSMHYLGMLAVRLPVEISYFIPEVVASLALAIAASAVALWVIGSKELTLSRLAGGSLLMGGGIGSMHYVGMAAMRGKAMHHYAPWSVALSLVVAVGCSWLALWTGFVVRNRARRIEVVRVAAGALMGLGIAAMHYTAMVGITYTAEAMPMSSLAWTMRMNNLGIAAVALITLVVLLAALGPATLDARKYRELQDSQHALLRNQIELLNDRQSLQEEKVELLEANAKLSVLSSRDGLTGLFNRRHFDSVFATEFRRARREKRAIALLLIDVDCFKALNDSAGHQAGDECLRKIAVTLRKLPRRGHDVAARYGGEEFVVLLPGATLEGAVDVAEASRLAILNMSLEHPASTVGPMVTISVGVAGIMPTPTDLAEDLLRRADTALYKAKSLGRNRVVVSDGIAMSGR